MVKILTPSEIKSWVPGAECQHIIQVSHQHTHSILFCLPVKYGPMACGPFTPLSICIGILSTGGKREFPFLQCIYISFQFLAQNAVEFLTHAITRNKHSRICWQFFLFPDWTYSQCSIFKSYLAMSFLPSVGFCYELNIISFISFCLYYIVTFCFQNHVYVITFHFECILEDKIKRETPTSTFMSLAIFSSIIR